MLLWSSKGQQMSRRVVISNSVLSLWMAEHLQQRQLQSGFLWQHSPSSQPPAWPRRHLGKIEQQHCGRLYAGPTRGLRESALAKWWWWLMKWWEHLSVNPDEMFLSGKNSRSESFKTGRGTRPRAAAASWPRTTFRKSFPPMIQTPLRSKSKPDTMPFSSSPPHCGLHWSHYSPSVLWVTNRKAPQIFHECHTTFVVFLSLFDSSLVRELFIFLYSWQISLTICLLIMAPVWFTLASYFPRFPENVWLQWRTILWTHAVKNRHKHDVTCFLCLNNYLTIWVRNRINAPQCEQKPCKWCSDIK